MHIACVSVILIAWSVLPVFVPVDSCVSFGFFLVRFSFEINGAFVKTTVACSRILLSERLVTRTNLRNCND